MEASRKPHPDAVEITAIGVLCKGPLEKKFWSSSRGKQKYPYPIGYQATRWLGGHSYVMEVSEGPRGPVFSVTCEEGIACSGHTPAAPWEAILKKRHAGAKKILMRSSYTNIDGPEMFGFTSPLVQRLCRDLVGSASDLAERRGAKVDDKLKDEIADVPGAGSGKKGVVAESSRKAPAKATPLKTRRVDNLMASSTVINGKNVKQVQAGKFAKLLGARGKRRLEMQEEREPQKIKRQSKGSEKNLEDVEVIDIEPTVQTDRVNWLFGGESEGEDARWNNTRTKRPRSSRTRRGIPPDDYQELDQAPQTSRSVTEFASENFVTIHPVLTRKKRLKSQEDRSDHSARSPPAISSKYSAAADLVIAEDSISSGLEQQASAAGVVVVEDTLSPGPENTICMSVEGDERRLGSPNESLHCEAKVTPDSASMDEALPKDASGKRKRLKLINPGEQPDSAPSAKSETKVEPNQSEVVLSIDLKCASLQNEKPSESKTDEDHALETPVPITLKDSVPSIEKNGVFMLLEACNLSEDNNVDSPHTCSRDEGELDPKNQISETSSVLETNSPIVISDAFSESVQLTDVNVSTPITGNLVHDYSHPCEAQRVGQGVGTVQPERAPAKTDSSVKDLPVVLSSGTQVINVDPTVYVKAENDRELGVADVSPLPVIIREEVMVGKVCEESAVAEISTPPLVLSSGAKVGCEVGTGKNLTPETLPEKSCLVELPALPLVSVEESELGSDVSFGRIPSHTCQVELSTDTHSKIIVGGAWQLQDTLTDDGDTVNKSLESSAVISGLLDTELPASRRSLPGKNFQDDNKAVSALAVTVRGTELARAVGFETGNDHVLDSGVSTCNQSDADTVLLQYEPMTQPIGQNESDKSASYTNGGKLPESDRNLLVMSTHELLAAKIDAKVSGDHANLLSQLSQNLDSTNNTVMEAGQFVEDGVHSRSVEHAEHLKNSVSVKIVTPADLVSSIIAEQVAAENSTQLEESQVTCAFEVEQVVEVAPTQPIQQLQGSVSPQKVVMAEDRDTCPAKEEQMVNDNTRPPEDWQESHHPEARAVVAEVGHSPRVKHLEISATVEHPVTADQISSTQSEEILNEKSRLPEDCQESHVLEVVQCIEEGGHGYMADLDSSRQLEKMLSDTTKQPEVWQESRVSLAGQVVSSTELVKMLKEDLRQPEELQEGSLSVERQVAEKGGCRHLVEQLNCFVSEEQVQPSFTKGEEMLNEDCRQPEDLQESCVLETAQVLEEVDHIYPVEQLQCSVSAEQHLMGDLVFSGKSEEMPKEETSHPKDCQMGGVSEVVQVVNQDGGCHQIQQVQCFVRGVNLVKLDTVSFTTTEQMRKEETREQEDCEERDSEAGQVGNGGKYINPVEQLQCSLSAEQILVAPVSSAVSEEVPNDDGRQPEELQENMEAQQFVEDGHSNLVDRLQSFESGEQALTDLRSYNQSEDILTETSSQPDHIQESVVPGHVDQVGHNHLVEPLEFSVSAERGLKRDLVSSAKSEEVLMESSSQPEELEESLAAGEAVDDAGQSYLLERLQGSVSGEQLVMKDLVSLARSREMRMEDSIQPDGWRGSVEVRQVIEEVGHSDMVDSLESSVSPKQVVMTDQGSCLESEELAMEIRDQPAEFEKSVAGEHLVGQGDQSYLFERAQNAVSAEQLVMTELVGFTKLTELPMRNSRQRGDTEKSLAGGQDVEVRQTQLVEGLESCVSGEQTDLGLRLKSEEMRIDRSSQPAVLEENVAAGKVVEEANQARWVEPLQRSMSAEQLVMTDLVSSRKSETKLGEVPMEKSRQPENIEGGVAAGQVAEEVGHGHLVEHLESSPHTEEVVLTDDVSSLGNKSQPAELEERVEVGKVVEGPSQSHLVERLQSSHSAKKLVMTDLASPLEKPVQNGGQPGDLGETVAAGQVVGEVGQNDLVDPLLESSILAKDTVMTDFASAIESEKVPMDNSSQLEELEESPPAEQVVDEGCQSHLVKQLQSSVSADQLVLTDLDLSIKSVEIPRATSIQLAVLEESVAGGQVAEAVGDSDIMDHPESSVAVEQVVMTDLVSSTKSGEMLIESSREAEELEETVAAVQVVEEADQSHLTERFQSPLCAKSLVMRDLVSSIKQVEKPIASSRQPEEGGHHHLLEPQEVEAAAQGVERRLVERLQSFLSAEQIGMTDPVESIKSEAPMESNRQTRDLEQRVAGGQVVEGVAQVHLVERVEGSFSAKQVVMNDLISFTKSDETQLGNRTQPEESEESVAVGRVVDEAGQRLQSVVSAEQLVMTVLIPSTKSVDIPIRNGSQPEDLEESVNAGQVVEEVGRLVTRDQSSMSGEQVAMTELLSSMQSKATLDNSRQPEGSQDSRVFEARKVVEEGGHTQVLEQLQCSVSSKQFASVRLLPFTSSNKMQDQKGTHSHERQQGCVLEAGQIFGEAGTMLNEKSKDHQESLAHEAGQVVEEACQTHVVEQLEFSVTVEQMLNENNMLSEDRQETDVDVACNHLVQHLPYSLSTEKLVMTDLVSSPKSEEMPMEISREPKELYERTGEAGQLVEEVGPSDLVRQLQHSGSGEQLGMADLVSTTKVEEVLNGNSRQPEMWQGVGVFEDEAQFEQPTEMGLEEYANIMKAGLENMDSFETELDFEREDEFEPPEVCGTKMILEAMSVSGDKSYDGDFCFDLLDEHSDYQALGQGSRLQPNLLKDTKDSLETKRVKGSALIAQQETALPAGIDGESCFLRRDDATQLDEPSKDEEVLWVQQESSDCYSKVENRLLVNKENLMETDLDVNGNWSKYSNLYSSEGGVSLKKVSGFGSIEESSSLPMTSSTPQEQFKDDGLLDSECDILEDLLDYEGLPSTVNQLSDSKKMESIASIDHSIPVSTIVLNVRGEEVRLCVVCGPSEGKDRTLFVYKVLYEENMKMFPELLSTVTATFGNYGHGSIDVKIPMEESAVRFTPDGQRLVLLDCFKLPDSCYQNVGGCNGHGVNIISLDKEVFEVHEHLHSNDSMQCLAVPGPHLLISAGKNGCINCWEMDSGWRTCKDKFPLPRATRDGAQFISVTRLCVMPGLPHVVAGCDYRGSFAFWDTRSRTLLSTCQLFNHKVLKASLLDVTTINLEQADALGKFEYKAGLLRNVNGNHLSGLPIICLLTMFSCGEGLKLKNNEEGTTEYGGPVEGLIEWSCETVVLKSGGILCKPGLPHRASAMTSMGRYGVKGTAGGLVQIWEVTSGRQLCELNELEGTSIVTLATNPSSGVLATANGEGRVILYMQKNDFALVM